MKISVVVPVHNETDNVETLIAEIHQALKDQEAYEMIFVDDGSTDDTCAKLLQAMQQYPALRVLKHQRGCGQSRAVHSGVLAARFPWIATLDGDGQNDPADIPNLIAAFQQQNDSKLWMLAGFRHKRNDTGWRKFSSKFANGIRQAILHDDTPDTGCGLKLFLRDKFLALPYFDHIHRFLPALIQMAGGHVISVKVNHRSRNFGQSKYGTLDRLMVGIVDILGVIWLKKRHSLPVIEEINRG
ncbi:MAG: glycosyltransferase family 2 protein [Methylococcaceae bacterium]|nr:glycosyltransferase family 2 protein [Methylococcaceae bacterium]